MHLILTGTTGLVGGGVLDAMLSMPDITRISILTRRPVPMLEERIQANDPVATKDRVRVILHKDFARYDDALLQQLRGAAGVVWALGVSQMAVSKEYVGRRGPSPPKARLLTRPPQRIRHHHQGLRAGGGPGVPKDSGRRRR